MTEISLYLDVLVSVRNLHQKVSDNKLYHQYRYR